MLRLLRKLFGGFRSGQATLLVSGWWCDTPIKMPYRVPTPLGGRVSVITVCVDIRYRLDAGSIVLVAVSLCRSVPANVASQRRGECWFTRRLCAESCLAAVVTNDLAAKESRLRRVMLGKWREAGDAPVSRRLVAALNGKASPEVIDEIITQQGDQDRTLVFVYTKSSGDVDERTVAVQRVRGMCIRARDHRDGRYKEFRLDRISNAR